jgi:hypothetical protein
MEKAVLTIISILSILTSVSLVRFLIRINIFEGTWLNLQKTSKYFFEVFQDFIPLNEAALRRGLAGMLGQV